MTEEFKNIITLVTTGFKQSAKEAAESVKDLKTELDEASGKQAFTEAQKDMRQLGKTAADAGNEMKKPTKEFLEFDKRVKEAEKALESFESVLNRQREAGVDTNSESFQRSIAQYNKLKEAVEDLRREKERMISSGDAFEKPAIQSTSLIGKLKQLFATAKGGAPDLGGGFAQAMKSMFRYGLAIRSFEAAFSKVRSFAAEGLKNLVQFSSGTNSAISSMMSSLTQLKNSFAAAFSPILEVVAPYISSFLKMLADAITAVGAFFAALTGKSTYTKAVAVQQDYAASLSGSASGSKELADATDDAAEAQKELNKQLMGFDQINKLSDNSSSGAGSGGGAGGVGGGGTGAGMMFTEEEIPGIASDWVEMFREAWANADFTEIGAIIGKKLKDTLDAIPWDEVKATCEKVAKSLATFLNGFIEVPGLWTSIGNTIGNGFTVALDTLNTFWETFHWDSLASGFAEGLQAAFVSFNWGEVTRAISNVVSAALDFAKGFLEGINWKQLPTDLYNALVEAIRGINWDKIQKSLTEALAASWNAAMDLVSGTIELGVKLAKEGWSSLKEWVGTNKTLSAAVKLAKESWNSLKEWVGTNKTLSAAVKLVKESWSSLSSWIGTSKVLSVSIKLVKSGWSTVKKWLGDLTAKFNIKLPKVSVTWSGSPIPLPHFNVKWNAKGGILDGATLFGMAGNTLLGGGEAGREAILPLDRNTGWMEELAEKLAQRSSGNQQIVVKVMLDSRVVGQSVVDFVNGQAITTGVHPMAQYL